MVKFDYRKLFNTWFDIPNLYMVIPPVENSTGVTITSTFAPYFTSRNDTRFEFRLYDATTDTQLDSLFVDTKQSLLEDLENISELDKGFVSSFPLELSYFGPLPNATCDEDTFKQRQNACADDVKTQLRLNINDCLAEDVINEDSGFKVIADRYLKDSTAVKDNVVNLKTPRIIKVQWRMLGNDDELSVLPTEVQKGVPLDLQKFVHADNISNMLFEFDGSDSGTMRLNANVYSLGRNSSGEQILKHGSIDFNDVDEVTVTFDFITKYEGDPDYSISLQCDRNIKVWWEGKTLKGFIIKSEKRFTGTVDWIISQNKEVDLDETLDTFDKNMTTCFIDNNEEFNKSNYDIFVEEGYKL
jgi:hypothetical protein